MESRLWVGFVVRVRALGVRVNGKDLGLGSGLVFALIVTVGVTV